MAHRMAKNWVFLKVIHLVCSRVHHLEMNLATWTDDQMAQRMANHLVHLKEIHWENPTVSRLASYWEKYLGSN